MKEKTTEQLIKEFIAKGGKIQKLPTVDYEMSYKVKSTAKSVPELKTLSEGELLYGAQKRTNKKTKQPDYSSINMDLIPDNIKKLLKYNNDDKSDKQNNGGQVETNKNIRGSEANNKS